MGLFLNTFCSLFCAIGSFLFGYDSGIISSVIAYDQFNESFNHPSSSLTGAVVSTFAGGAFIGAAFGGWAADRLGRKTAVQIGAAFAMWGCAMQAGAHNIGTLLAGRIIGGLAIGWLSMTVPLYNTEIAPHKIRGFLVGLTQQMISFGFIASNWVGYACQFLNGSKSWRIALAMQIVPAFLLFVGVQFLPQSPRWLLEVGRDADAKAAVHRLNSEDPARAEAEYAVMHDAIKAELAVRRRRLPDLWATPAMLKRTLVACGVQVFGQFTGINVISYYSPTIYKSLGLSTQQALLVQGIFGAVGPITNLIFIVFILDAVGRKKPLIFGAAGFSVLFAILGALVASFPPTDTAANHTSGQRAAIAMIFLMTMVFSLSFGPVSWVLASEVFPTSTRSIGTAVATCSNWAFNVMISEVSPIGLVNVGWKFYMLFVALNFVDCFVIAIFFPETKGKSLEDMAVIFGDEIDPTQVLSAEDRVLAKGDPETEKGDVAYTP